MTEQTLNASKVATELDQMHAKAANEGQQASGAPRFSFDMGTIFRAYQIITQAIPLVAELLKLIGSGGTVSIDTAAATRLREKARSLGITPLT
jgi:hypothetical protein